ncbi:MAG: hypothetical protein IJ365_01390, partial [Clostridia bacterium]|nr:hypothetical protein [Clostridia bacterium]
MKKYRLISLILLLSMFVQLLPAAAEEETKKEFEPIQAASSMTDEEFFGIWSGTDWILEPKLGYAADGMEKIADAAKNNNMELAKQELLAYYQSKDTKPAFSASTNAQMNYLSLNDSYSFTESYITSYTISGSEFKTYEIDLAKNNANGAILLCTLDKFNDVAEIKSRESGTAPQLLFLTSDGIVTIEPQRDTYIRGGVYADTSYGADNSLYVKDSYSQTADGRYLPYGDNSRYTYIYFDPTTFPSDYSSIKLRITARVTAEEGCDFADEAIKLAVFQAYNKTWSEYEGDEENQKGNPPITWSNYKIGHYSWKGLPGGFDWQNPENTASEWFNYNTRFYDQVSLMRTAENNGYTGTDANGFGYGDDYVYKAMSIMQDFISDGGAG